MKGNNTMKILYVTTIGATMRFFKDFVKQLSEEGHTVEIATNEKLAPVHDAVSELGFKVHQISCVRTPFNKGNIKAIRQLKKIVSENEYDIVHCHTPIAAMCTRLACINQRKKGTKVFYTAHGFHFYKGAPLKNWLIYYPIEKICSYFTDTLITINKEDYALAQKKMKAKKIEYVAGVGLDTKRFLGCELSDGQKLEMRKEIGVPENAKLLLSIGELNQNKNHQIVLKALSLINNDDIHYAIAGIGSKGEYLKNLAKEFGLEERFHLLGYRKDVEKLYKSADCLVHPSFREGLPVSVMEAMCSGLALVVADNRGNSDLCEDGTNGFICSPFKPEEFANSIKKLLDDENLRKRFGKQNIEKIKQFDVFNVITKMEQIYFN